MSPVRTALTLLELVVVVTILVALACLVVPLTAGTTDHARRTATRATQAAIVQAIMGAPGSVGFYADLGHFPADPADLLTKPAGSPDYDPTTGRGWRGPYLLISGILRDAWDEGETPAERVALSLPPTSLRLDDATRAGAALPYTRAELTSLTIRAAGPDRLFATADDLDEVVWSSP